MTHMRNVLGSLKRCKLNAGGNAVNKPVGINARKIFMTGAMILLFGIAALGPASQFACAQTSGSAPTFNATVQGESASTVEGTMANVVNYIGNVICPIGAGLMVAATVVEVKRGKSWVPPAVTAVGLLAVSGITRLIESMVLNGQSAVQ